MYKKAEKIAFVSNTSWSLYNFRVDVIRHFVRGGFEVYCIAPKDHYSTKLIAEGAHFIPLKLENYSVNPIDDLYLIGQLWRLYRRHHFDHIFHYTIKPNIYGSIIARLLRLPHHVAITTGLGRLFRFSNILVNMLSVLLYRIASRAADEVWFLNEKDKKTFVDKKIVKIEKTRILPSEGIDTLKFRPFGIKKNTPIIRFLFAGRLLRDKGIELFVHAARELRKNHKHLRFEVLGYIDERNPNSISHIKIKEWQQAGYIKYLGSTEDVRPFLERADCVVFPSYYQEGVSRILLEAASMATPIISSDQNGCIDIVKDGKNGFVCRKNDLASLNFSLRQFINLDKEERMIMGQSGRRLVKENYDISKIVEIYENSVFDNSRNSNKDDVLVHQMM